MGTSLQGFVEAVETVEQKPGTVSGADPRA
jgi:hypothetical protein